MYSTSDYAVRHAWDRLVKRAGIENLRFQDLRHEAVSRFLRWVLACLKSLLLVGIKNAKCWNAILI